MAACFFGEMSYVKPPASDVLKGMLVPKLSGKGATGDAIALLGALVMPYDPSFIFYFSPTPCFINNLIKNLFKLYKFR